MGGILALEIRSEFRLRDIVMFWEFTVVRFN